jgi:hypothetical protein
MKIKMSISLIALILFAAFLILFLIIPASLNSIVAYIFANLGIILLWTSTVFLVGEDNNYPIYVQFPVEMRNYFILEIIFSFFVLLIQSLVWELPWVAFLLIHFVILFIFIVRIIILYAGKKNYIDKINTDTNKNIQDKNQLLYEIDEIKGLAIKNNVGTSFINSVYETLKYSDPIKNDSSDNQEKQIQSYLKILKVSVEKENEKEIKQLCMEIKGLIEKRNKKIKENK